MRLLLTGYLLGCSMLVYCGGAAAQSDDDVVSSDEIAKALEPPPEQDRERPKTRSLGFERGIGVRLRAKVDLKIPFELNSSRLAPGSERQLDQLSKALTKEALANYRFEVAGHTDASGSAAYNRQLSERRAESVKRYLIDQGVNPDHIRSVGYGEDELLHPDDPRHPDNRRVEIRNLGEIP